MNPKKLFKKYCSRLELIVCVLVIFTFINVSAQTLQNNFVHFTQKEGLPSDAVTAIMQDHLGYIWIGTNNGLSRYDGYEFYNFSVVKDDSNFLQLPLVTSLHEDSDGDIWIGAIQGITKYDREKETFKLYDFGEFEKSEQRAFSVSSICETKEGDILIGVYDWLYRDIKNGLYIIKNGSPKVERLTISNTDSTNAISTISPIENDSYYITGINGFAEYNHQNKNISWYPLKEQKIVSALLQDENDMVWLGVLEEGVYLYNTKEKTYEIFPIPNNLENDDDFLIISDIMFDQNKNLLITTNRGLALLDIKSKKITFADYDITNPSALHSTNLRVIMKDNSRSIWIATGDAGISKYNSVQNNFRSYHNNPNNPNSIEPYWIGTMFEYDDNELWFKTNNNTISKFDRKSEIFNNVTIPELESIWEIYRDKSNQIWITGWKSLYKLNAEKWSVENVNVPFGKDFNLIPVLLEDSKNIFWAGTVHGLFTYDKKTI